jgi:hypothetical protein
MKVKNYLGSNAGECERGYRQYYYEHKVDHIFGLKLYDFLKTKVERHINAKSGYLDARGFHMIYQHKILAQMVMDFLVKHGYIRASQKLLGMLNDAVNSSLTLRNLVLKFNQKHDTKELGGLITRIDKAYEADERLFEYALLYCASFKIY